MTEQTLTAIAEAEALLFVIDARAGVTAGDEIIAQALRKSGKPVILAANKCEGRVEPPAEVYGLGFGEPLAISAEHDLGMDELAEALDAAGAARAAMPTTTKTKTKTKNSAKTTSRNEDVVVDYLDQAAAPGAGGAAQCRQVQPVQPAAGRGTLPDRAGSRPDARCHHRALEERATATCCCTTRRACARRRGWRARRWRKCRSPPPWTPSASPIA